MPPRRSAGRARRLVSRFRSCCCSCSGVTSLGEPCFPVENVPETQPRALAPALRAPNQSFLEHLVIPFDVINTAGFSGLIKLGGAEWVRVETDFPLQIFIDDILVARPRQEFARDSILTQWGIVTPNTVFDLSTPSMTFNFRGHADEIRFVAEAPNGDQSDASGRDTMGQVHLWYGRGPFDPASLKRGNPIHFAITTNSTDTTTLRTRFGPLRFEVMGGASSLAGRRYVPSEVEILAVCGKNDGDEALDAYELFWLNGSSTKRSMDFRHVDWRTDLEYNVGIINAFTDAPARFLMRYDPPIRIPNWAMYQTVGVAGLYVDMFGAFSPGENGTLFVSCRGW